jgi:hypothetical protein
MRLYYTVDAVTNNCQNKCPFVDIGLHRETGTDCQLGSVTCQECKHCYGHHDNGFVGLPKCDDKVTMFENRYVKCMFIYKNKWKYKILRFFYRIGLINR